MLADGLLTQLAALQRLALPGSLEGFAHRLCTRISRPGGLAGLRSWEADALMQDALTETDVAGIELHVAVEAGVLDSAGAAIAARCRQLKRQGGGKAAEAADGVHSGSLTPATQLSTRPWPLRAEPPRVASLERLRFDLTLPWPLCMLGDGPFLEQVRASMLLGLQLAWARLAAASVDRQGSMVTIAEPRNRKRASTRPVHRRVRPYDPTSHRVTHFVRSMEAHCVLRGAALAAWARDAVTRAPTLEGARAALASAVAAARAGGFEALAGPRCRELAMGLLDAALARAALRAALRTACAEAVFASMGPMTSASSLEDDDDGSLDGESQSISGDPDTTTATLEALLQALTGLAETVQGDLRELLSSLARRAATQGPHTDALRCLVTVLDFNGHCAGA